MSYDINKLVNLGQIKSAVTDLYSQIQNNRAVRTLVTISPSNWAVYDDVYRYPRIVNSKNHFYYDIHLAPDTSNTISIMCANADIRARIENNGIFIYAYGEKPTDPFVLEVIAVPIVNDLVALSYDIGDDFLVYPAQLQALDDRVVALETKYKTPILTASNVEVDPSRWVESNDATYPYKADLNIAELTAEYFPMVQFSDADVAAYDFSPSVSADEGILTIYCKTAPDTVITLASIFCFRGESVIVS